MYSYILLRLHDEDLSKATLDESKDTNHIQMDIWDNIYVKYEHEVCPYIFKPYEILDHTDIKDGVEISLFRIKDRLILLNEIVTSDVESGGAGLYVPALQNEEHCVIDFFALHTIEQLHVILDGFFSWKALTYSILTLPIEEIRVYFGEYIALYFYYLQWLTQSLIPLSILGFIATILQGIFNDILFTGIEFVSLAAVVYSIVIPIFWRRKEFQIAERWGTLRFDQNERHIPEFKGKYQRSTVDGSVEEYYSASLRNIKRFMSTIIMILCLAALIGSVFGVIFLRVFVANTNLTWGSYMISIANALIIMIFNGFYGKFAEVLNSWENYKTFSAYENNLIVKIFLFRFINSYASLYYLAFFRQFEEDTTLYCETDECMADLRSQLAIIFITQIVVSNALELWGVQGKKLIGACCKLCCCRPSESAVSFFTDNEKDSILVQYGSEIYLRTFDDYCEVLIALGYSTLFIVAFPLAPFLCLLAFIIEARIDGYKLCKAHRRPFPRYILSIL